MGVVKQGGVAPQAGGSRAAHAEQRLREAAFRRFQRDTSRWLAALPLRSDLREIFGKKLVRAQIARWELLRKGQRVKARELTRAIRAEIKVIREESSLLPMATMRKEFRN